MRVQPDLLEDEEQELFIKWCRRQNIFVFAIANQQPMAVCCKSTTIVKRILKKLFRIGLEEGMPDLMIPIPTTKHHGLYIEMKRKKGKAASRQLSIAKWLNDRHYKSVICYSSEDAITVTKDYLSM